MRVKLLCKLLKFTTLFSVASQAGGIGVWSAFANFDARTNLVKLFGLSVSHLDHVCDMLMLEIKSWKRTRLPEHTGLRFIV